MKVTLFDHCTCGSGKIINECCYKKIITLPPGPKTGYSHPKCYARALNDCSEKITREHFVSKSVLELFGNNFIVKTPYLGKEGKRLNTNSLSSKVLCKRHNEALSPLDNLAEKFFRFLLNHSEHEFLIIRGTELEKWLLKFICGFIATGQASNPFGVKITGLEPPLAALHTLYKDLPLPDKWGLAIPQKTADSSHEAITYTLLTDQERVRGCFFEIGYVRLLFFLGPSPTKLDEKNRLYHHPNSIMLTLDKKYKEIHFGWPHGENLQINVDFF